MAGNDLSFSVATDEATVRAALERFVVENDDLLELEERIGRFNIFDALGVARAEIRHSNFLAWLLDPNESHGQGSLFLKAVLMDLLKQTPAETRPLSPIELDGEELRGVEVRREWRSIDLLIKCEQPAFVIAIENKVDSGEGEGQLQRYEDAVRQEWPALRPLHVFLTPDGSEASDDDWVPYSYADIHRVLERVQQSNRGAIGGDVAAFLEHYLRLIGSRMMDDPKLDELCRKIYQNHRQAIDLIVERGGVGEASSIVAELSRVLESSEIRWFIFTKTSRRLDFVPEAWLTWMPDNSALPQQHPKFWLRWFVDVNEKARFFRLYLEISPCRDGQLRRKVVERLTADPTEFGFRVQAARGVATDRYTRLFSERLGSWNENEDVEPAALVRAAWDKIAKLHRRLDGVPNALRPIFDEWNQSQTAAAQR